MNFEALANENRDAVYRQLIRACGNREDAEDVLVEALLKAYRNLGQLRDSDAFVAGANWAARVLAIEAARSFAPNHLAVGYGV
jgi:DNA-directed RNA polymerase specialized sigma24 family protein